MDMPKFYSAKASSVPIFNSQSQRSSL